MAESVKTTSRIVSEHTSNEPIPSLIEDSGNLEAALMEEFNLRLKNCMSQDDLQPLADDNAAEQPLKSQEIVLDTAAEDVCDDGGGGGGNGGNGGDKDDIFDKNIQKGANGSGDIAANIATSLDMSDSIEYSQHDQSDIHISSPIPIESDPVIDITLDETHHDTDNIDQGLLQSVHVNHDVADVTPVSEPGKSVKDRLFLCTDAALPCLMFTQTISASPMLTPSEDEDIIKMFDMRASLPSSADKVSNENESTVDGGYESPTHLESLEPSVEAYNSNDVENYVSESRDKENDREFHERNSMDDHFTSDDVVDTSYLSHDRLDLQENLDEEVEAIMNNADNLRLETSNGIAGRTTADTLSPSADTNDIVTNNSSNASTPTKKKKKSKKSKDNISVNGFDTTTTNTNAPSVQAHYHSHITLDDNSAFYNVNVKNLCRSFGDLSKVGGDEHAFPSASATLPSSKSNKHQHHHHHHHHLLSSYHINVRLNNFHRFNSHIDTNDSRLSGCDIGSVPPGGGSQITKSAHHHQFFERTKSSFTKFDALQKKNVLHVRSTDLSKAQEKFNNATNDGGSVGGTGSDAASSCNCKACNKIVFQMEQIKAEKAIWHRNCFRCKECNKHLNVDTYESHEGNLYCKPHFKGLFAPKVIEEDDAHPKPRKPELIIRENQPMELPPDVARASDKPDLGLEELQSLNVKQRFQVFEQQLQADHDSETIEKLAAPTCVKRSASILSKLARFQAKGMDIGVADEELNGIPIEASSSSSEAVSGDEGDGANKTERRRGRRRRHDSRRQAGSRNGNTSDGGAGGAQSANSEDDDDEDDDGDEDAELRRARRVQKEKPFHFTGMSDVMNRWEQGANSNNMRDERREERKEEIKSIRNRLFLGKQVKMKEAYQQAVLKSESCAAVTKINEQIEVTDTKSIKEMFEKGESMHENATLNGGGTNHRHGEADESEVYESEISKNSRSLFMELDANACKAPKLMQSPPKVETKQGREVTCEQLEHTNGDTLDANATPVCDESVEVAKESHTATKMLSKFRQLEVEYRNGKDGSNGTSAGPKPLKRFTPPPDADHNGGTASDDDEEVDVTDGSSEVEDGEDTDGCSEVKRPTDNALIEAQKAARAKLLRAKFEKWEANEIRREQEERTVTTTTQQYHNHHTESNGVVTETEGQECQIESTKTLRARFESMRETTKDTSNRSQRVVKVNRFVDTVNGNLSTADSCAGCRSIVYPLEKISVHGRVYHKTCFKCMECQCILRMDSYCFNQGRVYCLPHFKRLFIAKGNYESGFGLDQHKEKWASTSVTSASSFDDDESGVHANDNKMLQNGGSRVGVS